MNQVTIKDIAKQLNLSPSTISRVLHNHPDISSGTRERVLKLVEELDYHPNSIAQSLKKKQSKIIGVIVPQVRHYFFASIMSGITDVAYHDGYTVMICQSNESFEREVINVRALISQRVAGVLISISKNTNSYDHFEQLKKRGIPLVFFDRLCEDFEAHRVGVDDFEGAFKAVEHLIQNGYQRIAHLAGPNNLNISLQRIRGYRAALEKYNIKIDDNLIVCCGLNEEDGVTGTEKLLNLKDRPDAIFAVTDPVAIGAYIKLKENNIEIPDDIALVGFSDNPTVSLIDPPLTSVRQPAYEMGKTAAKLLLEQIENEHDNSSLKTIIFQAELIVRKSSCPKNKIS